MNELAVLKHSQFIQEELRILNHLFKGPNQVKVRQGVARQTADFKSDCRLAAEECGQGYFMLLGRMCVFCSAVDLPTFLIYFCNVLIFYQQTDNNYLQILQLLAVCDVLALFVMYKLADGSHNNPCLSPSAGHLQLRQKSAFLRNKSILG